MRTYFSRKRLWAVVVMALGVLVGMAMVRFPRRNTQWHRKAIGTEPQLWRRVATCARELSVSMAEWMPLLVDQDQQAAAELFWPPKLRETLA